ncbi:hypothetical protein KKC94_01475 [Patescibacteria group bacterium]|nr:hypothetical protein [Patescibacteria group bacterium]
MEIQANPHQIDYNRRAQNTIQLIIDSETNYETLVEIREEINWILDAGFHAPSLLDREIENKLHSKLKEVQSEIDIRKELRTQQLATKKAVTEAQNK